MFMFSEERTIQTTYKKKIDDGGVEALYTCTQRHEENEEKGAKVFNKKRKAGGGWGRGKASF